ADLSDADLRGADFSLANVTKVNLTNANLEGALVTGNTSFKGSIITGADFTDVPLREDQKEYLCKIADGVNPTTAWSLFDGGAWMPRVKELCPVCLLAFRIIPSCLLLAASIADVATHVRLTKSAHFLPIREDYKMEKLARIYINELWRDTKELNMRQRRWIELLSDYKCEIRHHPGRANLVADALSGKETLKPRQVHAMSMTIYSGLKTKILEAQGEASKDLKAPVESLRGLEAHFERQEDDGIYFTDRIRIPSIGHVRKLIMDEAHTSKYSVHPSANKMYRTDFASWQQRIRQYCQGKKNGVNILKSIDEGPFQMGIVRETLAEGTGGAPHLGPERPRVYSDLSPEEKDRESQLIGPEIIQETTKKIMQMKERLKTERDRQKSYPDKRCKPFEFNIGDRVLLKRGDEFTWSEKISSRPSARIFSRPPRLLQSPVELLGLDSDEVSVAHELQESILIVTSADMNQDSAYVVAASKVPMLKPVIENGATLPKIKVIEGVTTKVSITTAEEKAQKRLEVKVRSTLMMGISNEHQLKFNSIKDAKKLLEAVKKRFDGNAATKKTQKNLLKQQYKNFTAPQRCLIKLLIGFKFLRFLKKIRRKLTVNGNETIGFDKSNVECYNCHKRRHFARECKALRNQDEKHKESSRRSVHVETSISTALVSCDGIGGYD
nr:thylakoid lumenal 15 kDa protein 1, chloroplastic [Tanacetum cinerariifolium]